MEKQHFIALADKIRAHNVAAQELGMPECMFSEEHLKALADFCESQNPRFDRERWLRYTIGECGPNGGQKGKLCAS